MLMTALLIAAGALFILWKIPSRKVFGMNLWFDLAIVAFFTVVLHGTFAGMAAGLIAGMIISCYLLIGRWFVSYDKMKITKRGVSWEPVTPPIPKYTSRLWRKVTSKRAT